MFNEYLNFLLIFNLKDLIEILFFSILIYYCSIWLKADKQLNLLPPFYLLLTIFIFSNLSNMFAISQFLVSYFPTILTIFFLIHQKTLQKNMIALKKIKPLKEKISTNWFEDFIRICFHSMNNNKQIICIIEGNDSLSAYLKPSFNIPVQINKELTEILIDSYKFDQQKMLWITYQGTISGINTDWNIVNNNLWFDENNYSVDDWQQNAIIFSSKFDCIIFKTDIEKHKIDIIIQGRLIEDLNPNNAFAILEQFIKKNEMKVIKKDGYKNESKFKTNWPEQQLNN